MAKVSVQIELEQEFKDVMDALVGIASGVKSALADGKVDLAEIMALATADFGLLVKAAQGIDQLPVEAKEDLSAFVKTGVLGVSDIVGIFLKKV